MDEPEEPYRCACGFCPVRAFTPAACACVCVSCVCGTLWGNRPRKVAGETPEPALAQLTGHRKGEPHRESTVALETRAGSARSEAE